MKRLTMLVAVAAVAFGGSAFSQSQDGARSPNVTRGASSPRQASDAAKAEAPRGPVRRAADATRRAASRSADAVRRTGQAVERRLPPAPANQRPSAVAERGDPGTTTTTTTAASGAPGDRGDRSRQGRMDDAYTNWKQQQGSSTERR